MHTVNPRKLAMDKSAAYSNATKVMKKNGEV